MRSSVVVAVTTLLAGPAVAHAQVGPSNEPSLEAAIERPRPPLPGLTLAAEQVSLSLTLEIESSAGKATEPTSVAPDLSYGVTDDLTMSIVHSRFAMTGFRAAVGGGVCLTDGCRAAYNNVGLEGLYGLARGRFALAAVGGVYGLDLDAGHFGAKLGLRGRLTAGKVAVTASPSVILALTNYDEDEMGVRPNKDTLWLPVLAAYRLLPALTVGASSGLKGPIQGFGDGWEVPVGVLATYAIDPRVTIGGSFVFGKLVGGADDPAAPAPDATGPDYRGTQFWVTVTP